MSTAQGTPVFVYDIEGLLVNSFNSARDAEKNFNVSRKTIKKYIANGKLFKGKWTFHLSEKKIIKLLSFFD